MRLKDRVAIVTGASKGIGEAIACAFAREGANLVLAARSGDALEVVAAKAREAGVQVITTVTDVTQEPDVEAMVKAAREKFGRIDILVNNAGAGMWRHVSRTSLETWEWLIGVNLRGPFLCIKHVWEPMVAGGGGAIINIGSTSGSRSFPLMAAYSSSKWGLVGLTKSCAAEGGPLGIRVNVINPHKVAVGPRASIADKEPVLEADDVVGTVIFLASDDAKHVHGQLIEVEHAPESKFAERAKKRAASQNAAE
jgi:NAD(P)-dependent dehydrogenase (short-subunit alcohol dehydrogenase family)